MTVVVPAVAVVVLAVPPVVIVSSCDSDDIVSAFESSNTVHADGIYAHGGNVYQDCLYRQREWFMGCV